MKVTIAISAVATFLAGMIQSKKTTRLFLIPLALASFAFWPTAQGVIPPPDGGYPNSNTAEGQDALFSLTSGRANTANGYRALYTNTTGYNNTATGFGALRSNTTGGANTATGVEALSSNTDGDQNTADGMRALRSNTTGSGNTANGHLALQDNTTGLNNTANGRDALMNNQTGNTNTAIGASALLSNTTGNINTATGAGALGGNTTGDRNTANGHLALGLNRTGSNNTASGFQALSNNATGDSNIGVGNGAGSGVTTADDVICIGAAGANVSHGCYIGNIFSQSSPSGLAVFVNSDGKLGTTTSSRRFKEDIKPMDKTSEAILALQPVTFRYKKDFDPTGTAQFGLVAEEVAKVNPDLVVRDKEGKPYSVRYDQVNAMLLNELLKEHRKVQKLEASIAKQQNDFQTTATHQQRQIEALTAGLQKVSDRLELSKPAPQSVLNNQ